MAATEKTAEQYLETLKTFLGGRLPEKVERSVMAPPMLTDQTSSQDKIQTGPQAPHTVHDTEDHTSINSKRAPLLYPPMTELSSSQQAPQLRDLSIRVSISRGIVLTTETRFCPLLAVVKFPYKFVHQSHMQAIASMFFDAGKIWEREWDLFYIWSNDAPTATPVIFITAVQFLQMIEEINAAFPELRWALSTEHEQSGLVVEFPQTKEGLGPQRLGVSQSREQHDTLISGIDSITPSNNQHLELLAAFRDSVELASNAAKNKSKAQKKATHSNKIQQMSKQLTLAKEYVGWNVYKGGTGQAGPATGVPQSERSRGDHVILCAIDCEAYERDQSKITEVGVATLDTHELLHLPTSANAEALRACIHARHFRIAENRHLVNKDFIAGRPDSFEFGTSEVVGIKDIPSVLASCFKVPLAEQEAVGTEASSQQLQRKFVLVGHDISQDIAYCHQLGFSILNRSSIIEVLDTASIFRAYSGEPSPRSLASILLHFDITAWNLHNAGNDAVYTLWALLAVCAESYSKDVPSMPQDEALKSSEPCEGKV